MTPNHSPVGSFAAPVSPVFNPTGAPGLAAGAPEGLLKGHLNQGVVPDQLAPETEKGPLTPHWREEQHKHTVQFDIPKLFGV